LERTVSGGIALGSLGLVEITLTEKEEAVLAEAVNPADVLWRAQKRDGPLVIPYLPHQTYTRWFNRAFGRTGWALVPVGLPSMDAANKCVVCPYILHIHRQPVAFAMGEQEFFGGEHQTYGDALESTVASALRRCAKRLGVGLELWDKAYVARLRRQGGQQTSPATDAVPPAGRPPAASHHPKEDEPITQPQRQRLWVILKKSGRVETEAKMWLKAVYGVDSTKELKRRDYDDVCAAIEATGPLPMPRDVGEEG
jgi:hypothetical protein